MGELLKKVVIMVGKVIGGVVVFFVGFSILMFSSEYWYPSNTNTNNPITEKLSISGQEYGEKWPYTIPYGTLNCATRTINGYVKKDVTISYQGKIYALNGSAISSNNYLPLDNIWKSNPAISGVKIPDPGIISRGLRLCR